MSVTVFNFNTQQVRVIEIDGDPWFVGKDICEVLEISNNREALSRLKDYEKGVTTTDTLGGKQDVAIISESGLYRLVLTSRKPQAEPFQDWVVQEVLPSIRKTGSYSVKPQLPQTYLEALEELVAKEKENIALRSQNTELTLKIEEDAPKVALAECLEFSKDSITFNEYAKIIGTGRTRLFRRMRELKIIMQDSSLPYQRWVDAGYFEVSEEVLQNGKIIPFALITGKGQIWLKKRIDHFDGIQRRAVQGIANGVLRMINF